ncbi:MAG: FecR domain-containing protein [Undibacterium sp.]|nr:FecR domain-containing protein [Opitutaceae bacterium]
MNPSPADFSAYDDAIETAAAEWLIAREEGFAPGRAAEFAAWRAADPQHDEAALRTERALDLIGEMPALRAPLQARLAVETKITRPAFFHPPVWTAGLAAAFALAAVVGWFLPSRDAATRHYTTAATRQQQIALVDGSIVNLNVSTDVQVALTPAARRVTLTAGEAHFAVAHDTARPFIVTAGGVSVRAVGTAFSVRLGDQGVEVLVTEGKVEVARDDPNSAPATALPAEHPLLVAGERTLIPRTAAPAIERVSADALQIAVRWHSPVMTFSDLPLRDAITLFNRRNATQLILADPALAGRKIGGTFAVDQVEAFVRLLAEDGEITVERRTATEIVLRRAP